MVLELGGCFRNEAQALTRNAFIYEGFTFNGWNTVQDGSGVLYSDGQTITATADMTLYAQWTSNGTNPTPQPGNTVTVTFDANGGTGEMSPQTFTIGTPQALSSNMFTREGWTYSDGVNGITNITNVPTDNINVPAGYYYITLTDVYGCTAAGEANILEANTPIDSRTRAENVLCHGDSTGNLYVTVYGGVPPYSYVWSNNATTQNVFGVPAGTYTVTITDFVGCEHEDQVVVTEPDAVLEITDVDIQQISCNGMRDGSINISVSGGTPSYTYYWSNGDKSKVCKRNVNYCKDDKCCYNNFYAFLLSNRNQRYHCTE